MERRGSVGLRLGWALAVCFLLVTAILVWTTNRLRAQLAASRASAESLTKELGAERRWKGVYTSPNARLATFVLTPSADPALKARAVVDYDSRRAVVVCQRFKTQSPYTYVLWALRGNTPFALGEVKPDGAGNAVLRVEDVGDPATLSAFAVTLEPQGSSVPAAPQGPIVMIGAIRE